MRIHADNCLFLAVNIQGCDDKHLIGMQNFT